MKKPRDGKITRSGLHHGAFSLTATQKTIAAKVAPASLLLACAAILSWSALRANAAWNFFVAETITRNMYEAVAFTPDGIAEAGVHLQRALTRFPRNPDYLDLAGNLKQLSSLQPGVVGRERSELLEAAAQDYRRALSVRPLWPYSWANLLSVKDKLGQVDSEFTAALHQAAETGPWEPRVQLQLIRSGVRHWDSLGSPERALLRTKVDDAIHVQPREVFDIAQFYLRPDLICGRDTGQPQIARWCQDVM